MEPSATAFARMPRGRRPGDEQVAHGGRRTDNRGSQVRFDEVENLPSRGDTDCGVMEDSRVVDPTRECPCLLRGIRGPLGDRFVGCAADDRHGSALSCGGGSLHHMNSQMTTDSLLEWLAGYERAWRTQGTDAIGDLFAPDARYSQGPYLDPVVGRPAIARMWEDTRDGSDEVFEMIREVVAIDGDTAVVRLQVRYGVPVTQEYRDLWIMKFAPDGRCVSFEEWPFWPGQPHTAADTP
jgi:ketosteroid isomerase-like protein